MTGTIAAGAFHGWEQQAAWSSSSVSPYLIAFAWWAVPALVGFAAGRLLRSRAPRLQSWAALVGLAAAPATFAALWSALERWGRVGLWDVAAAAILAGLGVWLGLRAPMERRRIAAAIAACAVALVLVEVISRAALPPARQFPPAANARLWFSPEQWAVGCGPLFPPLIEASVGPALDDFTRAPRRVLHLGDSMVYGMGVPREQAFPALLESLQPDTAHWNAGISGASLDVHLLLARAWLERVRPTLVVLHAFVGNDIVEMDRPFACCDGGPLLGYDGGIAARCPSPRWSFPFADLVGSAPPPYPVRVATEFSVAARHLCTTMSELTAPWLPRGLGLPDEGQFGSAEQWAHFEAALRALRDELRARKIPFVLSILPSRIALESPAPRQSVEWRVRERMIAVAVAAEVPALDAWLLFEGVVARDGPGAWFGEYVRDVHFNARGHDRYARWLMDSLR